MIAFVFPGQGSQHVGMGRELAEASSEARRVFDAADEALHMKLSRLCFEGPEEELRRTANTQPAILATSIACLEALREAQLPLPGFVAGHSLGEYTALVAAGAIDLESALVIVRERGRLMQQAVPEGEGAMAALLGLDPARIGELLEKAAGGEVLEAANYNGPDQIVIAGSVAAVGRAVELGRELGAKRAVALPVSAPFHCSLMEPAARSLAPLLDAAPFRDLSVPLVTNVDARAITSGDDARDALKRQVSAAVRWEQSMTELWDRGARTFVEIGPGRVLAGLIKRIVPREARLWSVGDVASMEKFLTSNGKGEEH